MKGNKEMKITKTEITRKVNNSSSWTLYITKTREEARAIYAFAMTQREIHKQLPGWYYSVQTVEILKDCRVPEFFHDRGYYMTAIEHNNGDWNATPSYNLYIVE